jgi:DNA-binding MarR family transcriptional regulator
MSHPRHALDEVIHAPVRLSIMAMLAAAESVEFRFLKDTIEVSDSLLSKHIQTLENAGYVQVTKIFVGKRPRTWLALTDEGREAFQNYTATLRQITEGLHAPETRDAAPEAAPDAGQAHRGP